MCMSHKGASNTYTVRNNLFECLKALLYFKLHTIFFHLKLRAMNSILYGLKIRTYLGFFCATQDATEPMIICHFQDILLVT